MEIVKFKTRKDENENNSDQEEEIKNNNYINAVINKALIIYIWKFRFYISLHLGN